MHQSPADLRFLLGLLIYEGALNPRQLWINHKEALQLHELEAPQGSKAQRQAGDPEFAAWVDNVGDDYDCNPVLTEEMLASIPTQQAAMAFLFDPELLAIPSEAVKRCFLTPLNVNVDESNHIVVHSLPGKIRYKYATDVIRESDDASHPQNEEVIAATLETVALLPHAGVPDHDLGLKEGQLCSLMRNISVEKGSVNHARVSVSRINAASSLASVFAFSPLEARMPSLASASSLPVYPNRKPIQDPSPPVSAKEGRMFRASGGVPRLRVLRPPLLRQISSAGRKTPRLEGGADGAGRRTASVR
ncbi:hypothetical protein CF319_g2364 [Tilletia indica]|nr:hypothetical protein CF319_g2364 [Tilletia indica]